MWVVMVQKVVVVDLTSSSFIRVFLSHRAKYRVVATDRGTVLVVLRLCVTYLVEVGLKRRTRMQFTGRTENMNI
jgi:multisubunit Na+/H+ antiporter MnhF subunit